jgi:aspartyl protease family protein
MVTGDTLVHLVWAVAVVAMAASALGRYRGRLGAAARDILIWAALGCGFVLVYDYRDDLRPVAERVRAEIDPGYVVESTPGTASVARRRDGHYIVRMKANGVDLPFLFDTGASMVTLRAEDAKSLGVDPKTLRYTETVSTANGVAKAALARLSSLSVGGIARRNVEVLVARDGSLNENLLGQNFLDTLAGYGVEGGRLVLRGS